MSNSKENSNQLLGYQLLNMVKDRINDLSNSDKLKSPFLSDIVGLSRQSHKQIKVQCQFQISEKCPKEKTIEYKTILDTLENNNGKYICMYCSKTSKSSEYQNPDFKFKISDEELMKIVDTEEKAYLLGWIASNRCLKYNDSLIIAINLKYKNMIEILRNIISFKLPIFNQSELVGFKLSSTEICKDIFNHLKINLDDERNSGEFPDLINKELSWTFIRGLFDSDGTIRKFTKDRRIRECSITCRSLKTLEAIAKFTDIKCNINNDKLTFSGTNCIDFLSKIYDTSNPKLRLSKKYKLYVQYMTFLNAKDIVGYIPQCKYVKTRSDAIAPSKNNASDEGYDLWIIDIDKKISDKTIRFDTGIKVQPESGFHIEILGRSSLSSTGYILANSIGLIDESYIGTLKVALTKVDDTMPDLILPYKAVQMVLRKSIHYLINEVEYLDETQRGEGGFGSTDLPKTS